MTAPLSNSDSVSNPAIFQAYFDSPPRICIRPMIVEPLLQSERALFQRFFLVGDGVATSLSRNPIPAVDKQVLASSEAALSDRQSQAAAPAVGKVGKKARKLDPRQAELEFDVAAESESFFSRVRRGLSKTRGNLSDGLASLLLGEKTIDDDLLEEIETQLIVADVGVAATNRIISALTEKVGRKELNDSKALYEALQKELSNILIGAQSAPFNVDATKSPYVILMVGVNGVGKTTTIGKLATKFQAQGLSVMLAAGDTFRAAAVEQLQAWGERANVPVVGQHSGADSASVIFDAVKSAKAKGVDVVIADTAGRLQNKSNLMDELSKITRVMKKIDNSAPHEVMLVLDAGTGQNAISQAKEFNEAVGLTGITLTKLDGTAKGGIVFAIADSMALPIRFIGVGEQADDLRPFEADAFVQALFSSDETVH